MEKRDTTPNEVIPYVKKECYRCQYVYAGTDEILQRHCPRCCYDSDTIQVAEQHVSEEERKSWIAAVDLGKMYFNWAKGYCGLMDGSEEADYSLLDDFMCDVMEQSFPYLHRLIQEKILSPEGLSYIRKCANEATILLLTNCIDWEERQRISGSWGDRDDEIKEHWLTGLAQANYALAASTPKRAELEDKEGGEG
jgi:hypothetical protein